MARFTKLPITIDAILAGEVLDGASSGRFHPDTLKSGEVLMPGWIIDAFRSMTIGFETTSVTGAEVVLINTQGHGQVRAERTDWIIRGVNGELYPCRPEIFEQTYEPGEGPQTLTLKGDLTPEQFVRFREEWRETASRSRGYISHALVLGDDMPVIVDQPPPQDRPDLQPSWELVIDDFRQRYVNASVSDVVTVVLADMAERDNTGRARYGVPLTAHNGRDQLIDAYQEALDFAVYLRSALVEGLPVSGVYSNALHNIFWLRVVINGRKS